MNYNSVKKVYEVTPKQIKLILSPLFIRQITGNPIYRSTMDSLVQFEKMSEEKRKDVQFQLLKQTLEYAYQNVPYYKKLFDSVGFCPEKMQSAQEIEKIPLLTKDMAIEAGDSIYSRETINCYESVTGGSSGRALKVLLDKDSIYRERAFTNHFLGKFGYDLKKTRTLAFWGHNKDEDYYYSPLKNEIVISPFKLFDEGSFETVWSVIEKFKPDFISGYPSAIYTFAQMMERNGKHQAFQMVDFYAENYTPEMKKYIENTLHCKAISNYGHTERAVFAEEYEEGYRFNDLYGYTEFLPTETEGEYKICCTGFISRKMPLIRYVTDDVVRFKDNGYAEIHGHKFSEVSLISKTGGRIFKGALTMHLDVFQKVKQYQYVQYEPGKVFLDLVLVEALTDKEKQDILAYLNRRVENQLDIELRIVGQIELTKRGKCNWAVSKIDRDKEAV